MKWTKDKPFWECPDEIDVAMIADALASLYRFLPEDESISIFLQCLEPERSEAVKICVVKACLALIVEVTVLSLFTKRPRSSTSSGLEATLAEIGHPFEGCAADTAECYLLRE